MPNMTESAERMERELIAELQWCLIHGMLGPRSHKAMARAVEALLTRRAPAVGHCAAGDACVCGGDTQRVREGCGNWRAAHAAPAPAPLHPAFNAADSHMLVTDHAQAGIMSQHNACAYRDTCRAMLPGHDLVPIPEALFDQMLGANSVRDEALEECAAIADALAKEQSGSEETHARAAKAAAEIIADGIRAKKSTAGQPEGGAA